jgi:hypothetical protein
VVLLCLKVLKNTKSPSGFGRGILGFGLRARGRSLDGVFLRGDYKRSSGRGLSVRPFACVGVMTRHFAFETKGGSLALSTVVGEMAVIANDFVVFGIADNTKLFGCERFWLSRSARQSCHSCFLGTCDLFFFFFSFNSLINLQK